MTLPDLFPSPSTLLASTTEENMTSIDIYPQRDRTPDRLTY